jgi:hypothetical protein
MSCAGLAGRSARTAARTGRLKIASIRRFSGFS